MPHHCLLVGINPPALPGIFSAGDFFTASLEKYHTESGLGIGAFIDLLMLVIGLESY